MRPLKFALFFILFLASACTSTLQAGPFRRTTPWQFGEERLTYTQSPTGQTSITYQTNKRPPYEFLAGTVALLVSGGM